MDHRSFRLALSACFVTLLSIPGTAQTPVSPPRSAPAESVTVTGFKSREMLDKFVKSFAVPTKLTGKIARWENGICPVAVGQKPALTAFVVARVKAIAAAVGAPVSELKSCTTNIEIVFTTAPQDLLDRVRKNDPDYLGYAETSAKREALATVTRPVQGWYATETIDLDGVHRVDSARRLGAGVSMANFSAFSMPATMASNRDPIDFPYATYARVTGNHINDGTRSGFNHIIIVIDSKKLAGQSFVSLADYIAMLALTQLNSLDTCQQLRSIVNMMAPDCDQKADAVTQNDLAYLRGLYKMSDDQSLTFQQNDIADRMKETLGRQ
jgi:hypothetical protein